MPARKKVNKFAAILPATPCTNHMRNAFVKIAESEDKSVAEVQRRAYALFLAQIDSKAINTNDLASIANDG